MTKKLTLLLAVVVIAAACGDAASETAAGTDTTLAVAAPTTTAGEGVAAGDETAPHDDEGAQHEEPMHEEGNHEEEGGHNEEMPPAEGEPTVEIDVVLTDFAFEPEEFTIHAGQTVRFHLVNEGAIEHEFRLSNDHRIEEHIASGHEGHGDEGHHADDADVVVLLAAGESRTVDVTFPVDTGTYSQVACLIPGHYEAGMFGQLMYE